ncbi:sphingomyelin phosphodiesterase [Piscirickettsia litoralis]|uniref:Endonuclease/exonuclease/phosphatase n=1 Tax=Piscirickettsia litoralis TaxID=1891921 RepID=A0ABX2ZYJ1_9GAMM|nr:sphingomyelin phosphodiesterase [Piscirickettsia litoralis]ODN41682.1 endonuclease/exonuclease/phosphatase [Piscirickettsia litoralis]
MKLSKSYRAMLLGVCSLSIASVAYAEYNFYFINNTDRPVSYHSFIDTQAEGCASLESRRYHAYSGKLQAYQRGKLLTINYDQGIKNGKIYCLNADISNDNKDGKTQHFRLTTRVKGDLIGSSIMSANYQAQSPSSLASQPITIFASKPAPNNVQLESIEPKLLWNNKPYKVYGAAIHYGGSDQSTNEIDYVLDQSATEPRYSRNDSDDQSLAVASYNVQLWPFYAGVAMRMNQAAVRAQLIPEKIKDYDVVVVEELMSKAHREAFINAMKQDYPYYYGPTFDSKLLGGGQMIFSHWPIVTGQRAKEIYKDCSDVDCNAAKGVLYVRIQKGHMLYNIIGTHLQATEGQSTEAKDTIARDKQFKQLEQFIADRHIPKSQPVVIAGDLNVDYQKCHIKGDCIELKQTILAVDPSYQPWSNINVLPYGGDYTKNLMNTGTYGEMDDYVLVNQSYLAKDQPQQTRIRVIRGVNNTDMYDGGSLVPSAPYAELDLSDHFLFESQLHFPRELFYDKTR